MKLIDQLEYEINQVLINPDYPVVSAKNFASRDTSLATGLSGLKLALGRNLWKPIFEIRNLMSLDIFSSELKVEEDSVSILNHGEFDIASKPLLGDLFTGRCNKTWSELTMNLPLSYGNFESNSGPVVRKGLAHGDLIRDFVKWINNSEGQNHNFFKSEDSYDTNGWCNGRSGFLVVSVLSQIYAGGDFQRVFLENEFDALLVSIRRSNSSTEDFGLCHGTSGVLVILAGLARLLNDHQRLNQVNVLYADLLSRDVLQNLLTTHEIDCSWLTGVSGVIWGYKAILKKPTFNPLAPFDSQIFLGFKRKP